MKYKVRSRWCKMLSRCEDEDHPQYRDYGGRDIVVCDEWHDFNVFYEWCMSNGFNQNLQLDRMNNSIGYYPDNCKFVTRSENGRNKRNNKILTAFGESKVMAAWAEDPRCEVPYSVLLQRIRRGWCHERAITTALDSTRQGRIAYNAKLIEAWGDSMPVAEWIEDSRCIYKSKKGIWERINTYGWPTEKALTQPAGKGRPPKV